jgi:hypothetical protein
MYEASAGADRTFASASLLAPFAADLVVALTIGLIALAVASNVTMVALMLLFAGTS